MPLSFLHTYAHLLNFFSRIYAAAKSFGKFKDSFLAELHAEISSHEKQEATGLHPQPVQGIVVYDSEVLEPEPVRQGGLMRKEAVRVSILYV